MILFLGAYDLAVRAKEGLGRPRFGRFMLFSRVGSDFRLGFWSDPVERTGLGTRKLRGNSEI